MPVASSNSGTNGCSQLVNGCWFIMKRMLVPSKRRQSKSWADAVARPSTTAVTRSARKVALTMGTSLGRHSGTPRNDPET